MFVRAYAAELLFEFGILAACAAVFIAVVSRREDTRMTENNQAPTLPVRHVAGRKLCCRCELAKKGVCEIKSRIVRARTRGCRFFRERGTA